MNMNNLNLSKMNAEYVFLRYPNRKKSRTNWMMQVASPGLCGAIYTFYNNQAGEEHLRVFLAQADHRLLGKANGYRVYCLIRSTREPATDEYILQHAQRIASEMADIQVNEFVDEAHLKRFRDLRPGEQPYGYVDNSSEETNNGFRRPPIIRNPTSDTDQNSDSVADQNSELRGDHHFVPDAIPDELSDHQRDGITEL